MKMYERSCIDRSGLVFLELSSDYLPQLFPSHREGFSQAQPGSDHQDDQHEPQESVFLLPLFPQLPDNFLEVGLLQLVLLLLLEEVVDLFLLGCGLVPKDFQLVEDELVFEFEFLKLGVQVCAGFHRHCNGQLLIVI